MPRRPVSMRRVSASTPAPNRAKAALAWATVSRDGGSCPGRRYSPWAWESV
jgi:hypothetical protein